MNRDHPALLTDVELDAIYSGWRDDMSYLRNLEYTLIDAAARKLLTYLAKIAEPLGAAHGGGFIIEAQDWQALRAAVGLDKEQQ